ncbi:Enolase [Blattella germanica]|nr:Enolase [Blattella germanica]
MLRNSGISCFLTRSTTLLYRFQFPKILGLRLYSDCDSHSDMPIQNCFARRIFDSRGNPTIECGLFRSSVPSGASKGSHEAVELRDGGPGYHGKDVSKAINNINKIIVPALLKQNFEVTQQQEIDEFMIKLDGSENKGNLGANAIIGVSMAVCKAGAAKKCVPLYRHIADLAGVKQVLLPVPCFNVINGAVGDEGGFAPNIDDGKDSLCLIVDAIEKAGYAGKIEIGMDAASSEFFRDGKYDLDYKSPNPDKSKLITPDKLRDTYLGYAKDFPLIFIEDPFAEDDWESWPKITAATNIQIKTGAPCRSERLAKYNQMLRIEEELGPMARYTGRNFRNPDAVANCTC